MDTLLLSPSFMEISVNLYTVPGDRPGTRQVKSVWDSPSGSQWAESVGAGSLVMTVKLQKRAAELILTMTESELVLISVEFTEHLETSEDGTWNRK